MTPIHVNLNAATQDPALRDSERIVASADGNHFFTFRPDWKGPVPLPFRAAAATVSLLPTSRPPKVLILGFGMGAVGALMRRRRPDAKVVGVEPDPVLCAAALKGLDPNTTLHLNDAASFLTESNDAFDLVFDDCFIVTADEHGDEQPFRPRELEELPALAKAKLRPSGLYVRNLLDQSDLELKEQRLQILASFAHSAERTYREWDNVLLVASDSRVEQGDVQTLGSAQPTAC